MNALSSASRIQIDRFRMAIVNDDSRDMGDRPARRRGKWQPRQGALPFLGQFPLGRAFDDRDDVFDPAVFAAHAAEGRRDPDEGSVTPRTALIQAEGIAGARAHDRDPREIGVDVVGMREVVTRVASSDAVECPVIRARRALTRSQVPSGVISAMPTAALSNFARNRFPVPAAVGPSSGSASERSRCEITHPVPPLASMPVAVSVPNARPFGRGAG